MTKTDGGDIKRRLRLSVLIAVLGVVYGDLGTSPLYTLQTALGYFQNSGEQVEDVYGILSLIFWSLMVVVTLKYVTFIMRADNNGEGGTLSLMALASRVARSEKSRNIIGLFGIMGAGLFFGDGVITPAISILSAIEGLEVISPDLTPFVIPAALAVIAGLFLVQRHGTAAVGSAFGPIMAIWFFVIGALGLVQIIQHPLVLGALNPYDGVTFILMHPRISFVALGAVVLAVTGAEALYADMSHFGRNPIRAAWIFFVFPSVVLNYFGQGALVLSTPAAANNPFFNMAPHVLQIPLVILATLATVIASQAVISGAYSVARICMQLGMFPRMEVRHTSEHEQGQIYVPQINALLAVGVILLVLTFRSSNALAAAYGIAVTGTLFCDNALAAFVYRRQFNWPLWSVVTIFGLFGIVDFTFFSANTLKIVEGGWVPLAIGLTIIFIMTTWRRGRNLIIARWTQDSLPLASFLARLPQSRTIRVPGTAVFMTGNLDFVPNALLHNLKHNKVLHEQVFFVNVRTLDVPQAKPETRAAAEQVAPGIYKVTLSYGFMESPNVPRGLESLSAQGIESSPMQMSYFLGRETVVPASVPKLNFIRRWLFLFMTRNAVSATEFFQIPSDRVVELGVRIAI
ncbi:putative potassium transport system protein kup [Acidocella aquatica]|uniref:Probable potassium transport system protein Kup n=2 Tax=Acidocella aquatica TaxID=1922313 RepID=A0ABQ6A542_9PROT|nr:potassium transporter Kup [Acidocella aquatica]GLR67585.1 putative potassium transport system protein kup [Acidocella aquatica]